MFRKLSTFTLLVFTAGCLFPYVYHDQSKVLVKGIDLDTTLEIAAIELEEGGFDATLTIWAIRDQVVTADQARTVSNLYFTHIDQIAKQKDKGTADFGVWHFTWAISNFYRNGDWPVRYQLEDAYRDARARPARLKQFRDIAVEHVNGKKIVMGDIHGAARSYARSHIVAPGNKKYLQSLAQYQQKREKEKKGTKSSGEMPDEMRDLLNAARGSEVLKGVER